MNLPSHKLFAWLLAPAVLLPGCGGGGDDSADDSGGYYAVQGVRGSSSAVYTVCIDDIAFVDPKSSHGAAITTSIVNYYGLSNWRAEAGTGVGCAQKFAFAEQVLSVNDYNTRVAGTPPPSSGGGAGTTGTGTGGAGVGGGTSSAGTSRGFITWTGSANGEVVLDATDEHFRFYADTRCMYSDNTQVEYRNFCLAGSGATVSFQGTAYTVTRIRSTSNSCITGLVTADGYYADIYSGTAGVEYVIKSIKRPVSC